MEKVQSTMDNKIKAKTKTFCDMVRYIKNKPKKQSRPNFSFLLGAGCSSSSGIKTAQTLIQDWKKIIYCEQEKISNSDEVNVPNNYFETHCSEWYKPAEEYSSLFEYLYQIPYQRKQYIEEAIYNKKPNIGYGYLVKLLESEYLDTIFTTNFDDLIQEAFYAYGTMDNRPIICAHDSSIQSISPFSERPKIIKLHGDFLYNNLKSSSNETQNLAENIRAKFEEFAQISGLIVIGYAGNDNSIINVLNELIQPSKNEKFEDKDNKEKSFTNYKQGIFWCLRENEKIPEKLLPFIDCDNFFFVRIQGFDELMCELALALNVENPINLEMNNDTKISFINNILENKTLKGTKSPILQKELEKLKIRNDQLLQKSESEESISETGYSSIEEYRINSSVNEQNIFSEIRRGIHLREYESVEKKIVNLIKKATDKEYKNQLNLFLGEVYFKQKKFGKTKKIISSLIENNPFIPYLYFNLINCTKDNNQKLKIINKAIFHCPYTSKLYSKKAQIVKEIEEEQIKIKRDFPSKKINEIYLKGVIIDKNADSECWQDYFDYNLQYAKKNTDVLSLCHKILNIDLQYFPKHIEVIRRQIELKLLENVKYEDIDQYIKNHRIENKNDEDLSYDLMRLNAAVKTKNDDMIYQLILKFDDIHSDSQQYICSKAKILYDEFGDLNQAIQILEEFLNKNKNKINFMVSRQLIFYYLDANQLEALNNFTSNSIERKEILEKLKIDVLEREKKWEDVITFLNDDNNEENKNSLSYYTRLSHAYLMLSEYDNVVKLLHPLIEKEKLINPYIVVNCELASSCIRKQKSQNLKKRERIKLIAESSENDNSVRAGAYAILRNREKLVEMIRQDLQDDFSKQSLYCTCFVFTKFNEDIANIVSKTINEVQKQKKENYKLQWQ